MNFVKVLVSGIVGTTFMTAYSYALAKKKHRKFEEPELLNQLVRRVVPIKQLKPDDKNITGWILHYAVGVLFSAGFDQVWKRSEDRPKPLDAVLLGGLAGLYGIGIWKASYAMHPNPPRSIDKKEYYGQLFVAHLIFGSFAAMGYKLVGQLERGELNKKEIGSTYASFKKRLSKKPAFIE